ncbi:MAG: hypothetical protein ACRD1X_08440 [Vicinamibacteria bacterium]
MTIQRIVFATSLLALLALASAGPKAMVGQDEPEASEETCCFSNPAYSGVCEVQPAEGETCDGILAYLNNPMAQGKDYCGGTQIRGGWTQVECEEEEP